VFNGQRRGPRPNWRCSDNSLAIVSRQSVNTLSGRDERFHSPALVHPCFGLLACLRRASRWPRALQDVESGGRAPCRPAPELLDSMWAAARRTEMSKRNGVVCSRSGRGRPLMIQGGPGAGLLSLALSGALTSRGSWAPGTPPGQSAGPGSATLGWYER